jgi:hypothetical protein
MRGVWDGAVVDRPGRERNPHVQCGTGLRVLLGPVVRSVHLSEGPVTVTFSATQILYNVTYAECGLPSGTGWSVTLDGVIHASTSTTIVFQEPSGSHT